MTKRAERAMGRIDAVRAMMRRRQLGGVGSFQVHSHASSRASNKAYISAFASRLKLWGYPISNAQELSLAYPSPVSVDEIAQELIFRAVIRNGYVSVVYNGVQIKVFPGADRHEVAQCILANWCDDLGNLIPPKVSAPAKI